MDARALNRRPIRSFVLRQGRFSPAQRRAHEELLPRFGIAFAPAPLDLNSVFGRSAPKILEIGSGMGETTAAIAKTMPEFDFLAIEVHAPGVGSLLKHIAELGLANIRIAQHDAVEVVQHMIAPGTLAGIHIFFPDPWPKKRHHKHRLLKPALLDTLAARAGQGSRFFFRTDFKPYYDEAAGIVAAHTAWALLPPGPFPFEHPTIFQARAVTFHSLGAARQPGKSVQMQ